jgi:hypothetical protein
MKKFKTFLELEVGDYYYTYSKKKLTKVLIKEKELEPYYFKERLSLNNERFVLEDKEQAQFSTIYCSWFSDYKRAMKTIKTKNKNYWLFLKIKKTLEKRRF